MANGVKWIKITTDIFDDEKILMIESMPSADSIIVIWFKLLAFAGKQNNDGVFLMSNRIAYTDEMLASIFRRDVNTLRLALKAFEQFGMIEIVDNVITIPNWGKHQSLDAYEKKKVRDRERIAKKRAEQKALIAQSRDMSPDTSPDTSPDVAFSEREREREEEIDKEHSLKRVCKEAAEAAPSPALHFGEFKNVILSESELKSLKEEFPDWQAKIDYFSGYLKKTGKTYASHFVTIRDWGRADAKKEKGRQEMLPVWMADGETRDSLLKKSVEKARELERMTEDEKRKKELLKERADALTKELAEKFGNNGKAESRCSH